MLDPLKVSDAETPTVDQPFAASADGKWVHLRPWAIGFALALLLHGAVAIAVFLAWQKWQSPPDRGPVLVELPPPSAEPAPRPQRRAEQPSAGEQVEANRAPGAPPKQADEIAGRKLPSVEEGRAEPTFAKLAPAAPSENAGEENARTASGGGAVARSGGEMAGPIDTRIAPRFGPPPPAKKAPRTLARKPTSIGRLAKNAGTQGQGQSRRLGASVGVAINAIGARVQDPVAAAIARAESSQDGTKNAIGSNSVANLAGSISGTAADLAVTNAIGMTVRVHPNFPKLPGSEQGTGVLAFAGRGMPVAAINGTSMTRPAVRIGRIGGAAKNVAGVLNGTDFRPRHP